MSENRAHIAKAMTVVLIATIVLFLAPSPTAAQPFAGWLSLNGRSAYAKVPHSPELNPTTQLTIEGWAASDWGGASCRTIVGKNFQTGWWVGVCNGVLRSYVNGASSAREGGKVPQTWFHFAVTFDGTTRRHYVNGEETLSVVAQTPLGQNTSEVRFGTDVSSNDFMGGSIDEVRIWSVARSRDEIRKTINAALTNSPEKLAARFSFDAPAHPVTLVDATIFAFPAGGSCTPSATTLCLRDRRYGLSVWWTTADGTRGLGKVVPGATADSGIFWFFTPDNWELMVKVLNACAFGDYNWAFSAATTNVHYELIVRDYLHPAIKHYFNYQGENAPALNDTAAFPCP